MGKGGRRVVKKASDSSEKHRELEPQQLAFVERYSTPPYVSIAKAAEAVGYTPDYAYQLARLPHVAAAIKKRTAELQEANSDLHQRLIAKYGSSAVNGDGREAREDAKIFLQALNVGQNGVKVGVTVNTGDKQEEQLEDRIKRIYDTQNT